MTAELSDSNCDVANRAQTLAALELKSHEKNSLVNGDVKLCEMSTEDEGEQKKTRSSWVNCALRDEEAVYWVSVAHYEAVAVSN